MVTMMMMMMWQFEGPILVGGGYGWDKLVMGGSKACAEAEMVSSLPPYESCIIWVLNYGE